MGPSGGAKRAPAGKAFEDGLDRHLTLHLHILLGGVGEIKLFGATGETLVPRLAFAINPQLVELIGERRA